MNIVMHLLCDTLSGEIQLLKPSVKFIGRILNSTNDVLTMCGKQIDSAHAQRHVVGQGNAQKAQNKGLNGCRVYPCAYI